MARPVFDPAVYLVTDRGLARGRELLDVVEAAVAGGAGVVQLREKLADTREFLDLARAIKARLAPRGVPLLVNDRVDVALAAGADGAHLGQSDLPYAAARAILGPDALIGLSVETPDQAREAEALDVDYLGVSPVFATPTKTDAGPAWGLAGLADLAAWSRHVLVGIGGIGPANAGEVVRAGARGVAVVSAICAADSPRDAASSLLAAVRGARTRYS
ncbi:MAG: thiamine phosphate synthase [Thermodesulfobacteriota bacterium]